MGVFDDVFKTTFAVSGVAQVVAGFQAQEAAAQKLQQAQASVYYATNAADRRIAQQNLANLTSQQADKGLVASLRRGRGAGNCRAWVSFALKSEQCVRR